jgi:phenylalanyl-tRNA synthetase beta chain
MLETGQPLHAFDRERLHEGRIVVRRARDGEQIETLDHQLRDLSSEMLVIADADRPVAVAGVMGGVDSEVADETTTLLLEGANFNMTSVRHTRMALKLRTDASARFERGLDPELVGPAMARAVYLLLELNPGAKVSAVRDAYPRPVIPKTIEMGFDLIERVLGQRYEPKAVLDVLGRLNLQPSLSDDGVVRVIAPTYRPDLGIPEDLIEEVARIIGYDTLPSTIPAGSLPEVKRDPIYLLQEELRRVLTASGAFESATYLLVGEDHLRHFSSTENHETGFLLAAPLADLLRVKNPIQADQRVLRPTLIPSLSSVVASNRKHERTVRVFEMARVYMPQGRDRLPQEHDLIGIVMNGARDPVSRFTHAGEIDYFDLKGIVEAIFDCAGIDESRFEPASHPALHPGRAARALIGESQVALFGELRPDVAAEFGIEGGRVCVAEVAVRPILEAMAGRPSEMTVPRFLPVEQDFAIIVAEDVPARDVEEALRSGAGPLASQIVLFDIFQGPQIGAGNKSLAYRVTFTAPDRALTDAELVKVRGRIERLIMQRVEGTLRS